MSAFVPSRRLLRHLASLCDASRPMTSTSQSTRLESSSRPYTTTQRQQRSSYKSSSPQSQSLISKPRHFNTASPSQSDPPSPPQPKLPDITNNYTLFPLTLPSGPPPTGPFTIPLPPLRREFISLQSQWHPDKFTDSTTHSKAVALSTRINEAYRTLSDPLLRAQYLLLHTYDIDVMSEDNSSHPTDQQTLMEVMEAQEEIEQATEMAQIERLMGENQVRIEETTERMGKAFERDDVEKAKIECVRLKYWRSLQDGLKDWEPGKEVRLVH